MHRHGVAVVLRASYLGIDQCVINADRASPSTVTAVFHVDSVEAMPPAAAP
jgi:hypothetical protein